MQVATGPARRDTNDQKMMMEQTLYKHMDVKMRSGRMREAVLLAMRPLTSAAPNRHGDQVGGSLSMLTCGSSTDKRPGGGVHRGQNMG